MTAPPPVPPSAPPDQHGQSRSPGFFRVIATVLSAFIGIRKRESAEAAHQVIKPVHIIVAGIIGALCFIAILVMVVRLIIAR